MKFLFLISAFALTFQVNASKIQQPGNLGSGKIYVGQADGKALAKTMSGAASISTAGAISLADSVSDGTYSKKVAKASFSFAGGHLAVGTHGLGVSLPAKAIITRSFLHITAQLVDTGTCSLAIQCEDANNIKTSTDISGTAADGLIEGESTGAASAFKKAIAAACEISTVMTDTSSCVPSAGAGAVFVEYLVHN